MKEIEVSTVVYVPPEEVYEFLIDFPRYADYSDHLREVRTDGDGGPGTRYDITFAWWKLTYTASTVVTEVDRPTRIDWRVIEDIDAAGYWGIEPVPEAAPEGEDYASRVRLSVQYRPDSADESMIDLPRFVSLGWVVEKVTPLVREEAEEIVERIVADLEGQRRDVALEVHVAPDSV